MQVSTDAAFNPLPDQRQHEAFSVSDIEAWNNFGAFDYDFSSEFGLECQPQFTPQAPPVLEAPQPEPSHVPETAPQGKTRVSLACVPCRSRHNRCDAMQPTCSQCHDTLRTCVYAKSRRNRTKVARNSLRQQSVEERRPRDREILETQEIQDFSDPPANHSGSNLDLRCDSSSASNVDQSSGSTPNAWPTPKGLSKMAIAYYTSFHRAHPVVLPSHVISRRLHTHEHSLQNLFSVMEFIGSLYAAPVEQSEIRKRAQQIMLSIETPPPSGFTVQALLILAIAIHSSDEFVYARELLDQAVESALAIGMNMRFFARDNGEGDSVMEESWRRTWWLLYMTDGIFSAVRHCSTFSLNGVRADVDIPCEEASYHAGVGQLHLGDRAQRLTYSRSFLSHSPSISTRIENFQAKKPSSPRSHISSI